MKSYACYPNGRTRFQAPMGGFVNPYFTQSTNDATRRNPVANRPAANIIREESAFKIQLAVPGVSKDQIKIEFREGQLIISGTPTEAADKPKFVREEFDYTGFKRTFRLHKNADTEATHASFDQGLLTIVIPDLAQVTTKINIL
jgi:HSP20 family molecular chaperone IbpA